MRERFAYCDIELKNIRQSHINQRRNSLVLKSNFSSALRFYGFLSYKTLKIDIINTYENDKNIMHYHITISRMWKAHITTTI